MKPIWAIVVVFVVSCQGAAPECKMQRETWSFTLNGWFQNYKIIGIEYLSKEKTNNVGFKVLVDDKVCATIGAGKLKRTDDDHIQADCDSVRNGVKVSIELNDGEGLLYCGDTIYVRVSPICPANAVRVYELDCECKKGFERKGKMCEAKEVKATECPATGAEKILPVNSGSAKQSTGGAANAAKALDAKTGGDYSKDTCTHTHANDARPWWSVEMTGKFLVHGVEIQNREDCCSERLADFDIEVDNEKCATNVPYFKGRNTIPCTTRVCGKKVTIRLPQKANKHGKYLTLCDVKIHGSYLQGGTCVSDGAEKILPVNSGSAKQSTGGAANAAKALDAKTGGDYSKDTCTHTQANDARPWWSVELNGIFHLTAVEIQNREDCCSERLADFDIEVDGKKCATNVPYFKGRRKIPCVNRVCGKKVTIRLPQKANKHGKYLTLCDVKLHGRSLL